MGSWYKTCGLSNLHITDGQEVMVVVLEKNTDETDRCYSTSFWKPAQLPFYSKYADYGRGDEDSGAALPYVLEGIKKNLKEFELGKNEYHDIEVTKDKFDIELFYEAAHESRLFKENYGGKHSTMLDLVMIRKDIADDILTNYAREVYMGDGKGDCGYNNNYTIVNFTTIIADLPDYMAEMAKMFVAPEDETQDELAMRMIEMKMFRGLELFDYGHPNLVNKWVRGDGYRFSNVVSPADVVFGLMKVGQIKEATEVMIDLLKFKYIDCFMETTRRNWAPGGHEGSQGNEAHGYRVMAEATMRALDREKQEWLTDTGETEADYSEF